MSCNGSTKGIQVMTSFCTATRRILPHKFRDSHQSPRQLQGLHELHPSFCWFNRYHQTHSQEHMLLDTYRRSRIFHLSTPSFHLPNKNLPKILKAWLQNSYCTGSISPVPLTSSKPLRAWSAKRGAPKATTASGVRDQPSAWHGDMVASGKNKEKHRKRQKKTMQGTSTIKFFKLFFEAKDKNSAARKTWHGNNKIKVLGSKKSSPWRVLFAGNSFMVWSFTNKHYKIQLALVWTP